MSSSKADAKKSNTFEASIPRWVFKYSPRRRTFSERKNDPWAGEGEKLPRLGGIYDSSYRTEAAFPFIAKTDEII